MNNSKQDIKIKDWYIKNFKEFEDKLNGESKSDLHLQRKKAIVQFEELNFPTTKDEEWKYTNISSFLSENLFPNVNENSDSAVKIISENFFTDFDSQKLLFINGRFSEENSEVTNDSKFYIGSLAKAIKDKPELVNKYLNRDKKNISALDALNSAFVNDGLFIHLGKSTVVERPIQVLFYTDKENSISLPKNIIVAEENSNAKVIIRYLGKEDILYANNIATESYIANNAIVDIYKIQNESEKAYHFERVDNKLARLSVLNHFNLSFGSAISRNDINSKLGGELSEMNLNGLYLGANKQHMDSHTFVDHAVPNCESNELYKGILDDNSHGVFCGKILVREDAQKTNAFQSNKTILLSENANIDTKPQLEIYADDVKCSHGATIGQLDEVADFYIRSRGVPAELAKSMLIRAFANDVIEKIKIPSLKEQLNHMIFEHLNRKEI